MTEEEILTFSTNIFALISFGIFDIIKGFRTAFYDKGILVEDRKEIAKLYMA